MGVSSSVKDLPPAKSVVACMLLPGTSSWRTRCWTAGKPLPALKLCDFGYSKNEFVDSRPKSVSGTPDYIAPEVGLFWNPFRS